MIFQTVLQQIGIALGLGLLIGLQREWDEPHVAGIRTFALITVFGTVCGQLSEQFGGWIVAAGLVSTASIIVVGGVVKFKAGEVSPGLTTEVAALLMFVVGGILVFNIPLGLIVGGSVAVLLHWKKPLHSFASRIGGEDIKAIIQLTLIALVILPCLPNKPYGPYQVLNPFHIWLMVVLIVGISVGGYIAYKFLGEKVGILLGGVLGGVISSTATTVGYARRSSRNPQGTRFSALVIMIASTILFARVAVEIAVVAPAVLPHILPQLGLLLVCMALLSMGYGRIDRGGGKAEEIGDKPAELKAAVAFGLLYGVIRLATAAAREHLGEQGLYLVALFSGLTDVDAITLSTANFIKAGDLASDIGWRMILVGALSNLAFKAGIVGLIGHRGLWRPVFFVFGATLAAGVIILFFWP